jgi:HEAT repeat protein
MRELPRALLLLTTLLALPVLGFAQVDKPADDTDELFARCMLALKDRNFDLRLQARRVLGPDGPFGKRAIPTLIDAFNDKEVAFSSDIAHTLADNGPLVVPTLLRALRRPEDPVRAGVAEALGYGLPQEKWSRG